MPRSRSTRAFRQPTREEENTILFIGYGLGELFDEKEIEDFMAAAKRRIVGEFDYAMEANPRFKPGSDRRPKRRTDNYIIGLGRKPSELARYVVQSMHRSFMKPGQLPYKFWDLRPKLIDQMIWQAQYDTVLLTIQVMIEQNEIWYEEALGIWQVCQSSVDEYHAYKRAAKSARVDPDKTTARSSHRVKADMRPFHGRVRSQAKRAGTPPGTSVSLA